MSPVPSTSTAGDDCAGSAERSLPTLQGTGVGGSRTKTVLSVVRFGSEQGVAESCYRYSRLRRAGWGRPDQTTVLSNCTLAD